MTEQVMELTQALGGAGQDEDALRTLCVNACHMLDRRLRDGLTAEDCRSGAGRDHVPVCRGYFRAPGGGERRWLEADTEGV